MKKKMVIGIIAIGSAIGIVVMFLCLRFPSYSVVGEKRLATYSAVKREFTEDDALQMFADSSPVERRFIMITFRKTMNGGSPITQMK